MKNVTIQDVADKAGVSVTTVSRVLNDRGYISEKMRKRVMDTIEELNYTPNEMARSFFKNTTKSIALIIPTTINPFFGELVFYVEKILAQHGYNVFLCNSVNDKENERKYLKLLKEKRVDGAIVGSRNTDILEYKDYDENIVSIETEIAEGIPVIQSDNYEGGKLATKELIEQGCREILCIRGDINVKTPANNRFKAYIDEIEKNGLQVNIKEIPFGLDQEEKKKRIEQIFQSEYSFDGVFAGDDVVAKLVLNASKKYNKQVPNDLKVIGFDGSSTMRQLCPELSTIAQPIEDLSRAAVDTLLDLLSGKKVKSLSTYPVKLIPSESTGHLNK